MGCQTRGCSGAAGMGWPFDLQATNLVGPVLETFENGSPVLLELPPFRFNDVPLATTTGSAFPGLDSIGKSVAADLGVHTNTSPNGFDGFIHDAAALVTSQSQPGSGSSGFSSSTGSSLIANTVSAGLTINVVYDSSVANAPSGFVADVNAAVQYLESQFVDPITITIAVGYGEVGGSALGFGALGESETYLNSYTYAQLTAAMKADATSPADVTAISSLLATNPTGNGTFWVSTAEAKALGLAPSDTSIDGYVGFASSSNTFDYNNADGVTAGQYDFSGVVLHELTEVMGRQTMNGQSFSGTTAYEPLDLFRYSAPGVHTFSGTKAGYFSADGGTTHLANFSTNAGGDFGDWASTTIDAMNAFGSPGMIEPMTSADITAMDVLGWNVGNGSPSSQNPALADLTTSGLSLSFGGPTVFQPEQRRHRGGGGIEHRSLSLHRQDDHGNGYPPRDAFLTGPRCRCQRH